LAQERFLEGGKEKKAWTESTSEKNKYKSSFFHILIGETLNHGGGRPGKRGEFVGGEKKRLESKPTSAPEAPDPRVRH